MKVAALQVPLGSVAGDVLTLIRRRADQCEAEDVRISAVQRPSSAAWPTMPRDPFKTAVPTSGILTFLGPVAGARLTVIVGFTELSSDGGLSKFSCGASSWDVGGCVS